ncbi:hypothetical protein CPHO_10335 [Corynebacterium phocae]|uniref:Uncharacterized protein n=1 Tax=Corynebacterium phocae TaxID=161895 RepID=A0A1L7D6L1_9CORY|nr:hypothetical protein CPHO_10335 [Corynebacterium phocae]
MRIFFQAGTPSCVGIRTEVAETATTVNIKLFTGALPGTDGPCTREAALASAVVTLDNPVGARVITGRDLMGSLQLSS